jgi:hypothetical protein
MQHTFGRADAEVLTGVERAAHTGRRITARRARRQKRIPHASKGWSVGPLTFTPVLVAIVAIALLAGAAGAAIVAGRGKSTAKAPDHTTAVSGSRPSTPATRAPTTVVAQRQGIFIRFMDAAKSEHYMYCTRAKGCDLIDVAKNGSSTIAAVPSGGVWHRVERRIIRHDPCINTVQNGVRVGKPGDLVLVNTTDLHPIGMKTIKGIQVPAQIRGIISTHFQTPEQPGCTFSAFTDGARSIDAPVSEYVP